MDHLFAPVTGATALIIGGVIILIIEGWGPRVRFEAVTHRGLGLAYPGSTVSSANRTLDTPLQSRTPTLLPLPGRDHT